MFSCNCLRWKFVNFDSSIITVNESSQVSVTEWQQKLENLFEVSLRHLVLPFSRFWVSLLTGAECDIHKPPLATGCLLDAIFVFLLLDMYEPARTLQLTGGMVILSCSVWSLPKIWREPGAILDAQVIFGDQEDENNWEKKLKIIERKKLKMSKCKLILRFLHSSNPFRV